MKFLKFFLLFWVVSNSALAQDKPIVVASINPLYQILLAITEDKDNSILIINPSFSEHDYQLKKSDVEFFSKADLVFYVDDGLENNFPKLIKNLGVEKKSYRISEISGIKLLQRRDIEPMDPVIRRGDNSSPSVTPSNDGVHWLGVSSNVKKIDPHLWLNPENAIKIAEFMTQKISEIDQKNSKKYQKNLAKFKKEVVKTVKEIHQQLAKINGTDYVIYHDGYQYFENYFGLKPLKIMSYDHSRELSVKDMRELDALAKSGKIKCIFGDKMDERNAALKLAQNYKIKFQVLDLIGGKGKSYYDLLFGIADEMARCLN